MPYFRAVSVRFPAAVTAFLTAAIVVLGVLAAGARAEYGELTRFGSGTGGTPKPGQLADERTRAVGVDTTDNSVYVADEPEEATQQQLSIPYDEKEEECPAAQHPEGVVEEVPAESKNCFERSGPITRHLRLQKFVAKSGKYAFSAETTFTEVLPETRQLGAQQPTIEGLAVSHEHVYLLTVNLRQLHLKIDSGNAQGRSISAASKLYAFSTKASGETLTATSQTDMETQSETPGKALLEPAGITADPLSGDVVILAHADEGGAAHDELTNPSDHYVLQRIKEGGALGPRYVDKTDFLKAGAVDSPIVVVSKEVGKAHLYINGEQRGLIQIPYDFEAEKNTPPSIFHTYPSENGVVGPVEHSPFGGALSTGVEPEGTIYGTAEVGKELKSHNHIFEGHAGVLELSGKDGSELGWTGGQEGTEAPDKCVLEPYIYSFPQAQVAAGKEAKVFVLSPEYLLQNVPGSEPPEVEPLPFPVKLPAVLEFGEGAEQGKGGCAPASDSGLSAEVNGTVLREPTPEVKAGALVTFSSFLLQADALSSQWSFVNETSKKEEAPVTVTTDELLTPKLSHAFSEVGDYTVTETIQTDDLATPQVVVSMKVRVTGTAPAIKSQPVNKSVAEGETATFTATATGSSLTTQWEVSTDGGTTWTNDASDAGNTSTTLSVASTTLAQSGRQYRAKFTNGSGSVTSTAATLTVLAAKAPTVTGQPAGATVTAGQSASFTATASGVPAPAAQWEVSPNGGGSWSADTADSGNASTTLTIGSTSTGQNGYEYRAKFTNRAGSVTSSPATLTVNAPKSSPSPSPTSSPSSTPSLGAPPPGQGVLPSVQTKPVPNATLAGSSALVNSSGALVLKVSCPVGESTCTGSITLRTLTAVSAAAGKKKKAILTLGVGSFSVAGGKVKAVTVHLSSKGRALFARMHLLRARATVVAHDPAGGAHTTQVTLTLRPAKKSGKH